MAGEPKSFEGRTVIITGGGSGVGFETAKLFVDQGARVLITGRNLEKLLSATGTLGENCKAFSGDVTDPENASKAVSAATDAWSQPVSGLVNNAGVILRETAEDTSDADWRWIMSVNVDGLFYMSREVARQMPEGGSIVNVSSTCGRYGAAGLAAYCASKGAVDQLTRTMALELAPRKITVNAVAPGAINSPMLFSEHKTSGLRDSVVARNKDSIPIGAIAEPEEIARAIIYLATERHITGSILRIDGGYTS